MAGPTPGRSLITGATGFLGGHLAELLAGEGAALRLLTRDGRRPELDLGEAEIIRGDLTDPSSLAAALEGIETVYHCAALLGPAGLPDELYQRVNVQGTGHLLDAARQAGVRRLVQVSSVAVLGPVGPDPADEDAPYAPTDIYEETKAASEQLALAAADELEVVVARPAWVYGPRDRRTLKLIRRLARRRVPLIGDGSTLNSPVFVQDVARGLLLCGTVPGISGRIYHLAGADPASVSEILSAVARAAGVPPPQRRIPIRLATAAAWLVERPFHLLGREAPLDRRKLGFFVKPRVYSILRARRELGYNPQVRLDEGMSLAVTWYREQGWL